MSVRRSTNSYRARVLGTESGRLIAFICECGDPGCYRTVALTLAQYERIRPGPILHEVHGTRAAAG